jgi:mannose-6-phosphate isomerase
MQTSTRMSSLREAARAVHQELLDWVRQAAYPVWSTQGMDLARGGFQESLTVHAEPTNAPRRARVQPRQVYAFALAPRLGWRGDASAAVAHGLAYFLTRYRRDDGLFRTLIAIDGAPLDERAMLYDQAFALLSFAAAAPLLGSTFDLAGEAEKLRGALLRTLKRTGPGFESGFPPGQLHSNPHMHLLEASLAWRDISGAPVWSELADEIGELALKRFIDPATGFLRETFEPTWAPAAGIAGRIVEPGHQFEWAHLLLRWAGPDRADVVHAAQRLIEIGERHGVRDGIAFNSILDDFSVRDAEARLWPQTERLKAAAVAARLFGDEYYWEMTVAAARGLLRYFPTPVRGVWYDRISPTGQLIEGPAPAGNLYHIVGGILDLQVLLEGAAGA